MFKRMFMQAAFTIFAAALCAGTSSAQQEDSPKALLDRAIATTPEVAFTARVKLSSHGLERELLLSHRRIDDKTLGSFLEVTAPTDVKDTRFLFLERKEGPDEQFVYVPAMRRVIQVGEQTRSQAFLGSDFYVSDLVTPDPNLFTLKFVGEENLAGRACRLIEAVPEPSADWQYSKAVYAVDSADLLVLKAQFFDPKGRLHKVWTLEKFDKIDGYWTPLLQKMNDVQENSESTIEMVEVKYNVDLPVYMFQRSHLER
jgi:hypothetical protein